MPNTTTHYQIPYPLGTEAADGSANMGALATRVDDVLWAQLGVPGAYVSPALTLTNANFTLNGSWAFKIGRTVTFMVLFTTKLALGPGTGDGNITDISVGTVVANYRPLSQVYFPPGYGRNFISCSIAAAGEFSINSLLVPNGSIAANTQFMGNTSFITP